MDGFMDGWTFTQDFCRFTDRNVKLLTMTINNEIQELYHNRNVEKKIAYFIYT